LVADALLMLIADVALVFMLAGKLKEIVKSTAEISFKRAFGKIVVDEVASNSALFLNASDETSKYSHADLFLQRVIAMTSADMRPFLIEAIQQRKISANGNREVLALLENCELKLKRGAEIAPLSQNMKLNLPATKKAALNALFSTMIGLSIIALYELIQSKDNKYFPSLLIFGMLNILLNFTAAMGLNKVFNQTKAFNVTMKDVANLATVFSKMVQQPSYKPPKAAWGTVFSGPTNNRAMTISPGMVAPLPRGMVRGATIRTETSETADYS
jgi:hypothetical protein